MKKYITTYSLIGILGSLFILGAAYAFFTSGTVNANNTFTAAAVFPTAIPSATPTPGPTAMPTPTPLHIVINEVNPNGSDSADWVELYNPTSSSIDVSGWTVTDNSLTPDTFPSITPIPASGFAVIVGSTSIVSVPGSAIKIQLTNPSIGGGLAAAADRVILKNGSTIIDEMSYGTDTTIFATPPGAPTSVQSIARHPNGFDTDSATDWIDTSPTLGITN